MDNLRGLLGIRKMDKFPNAWIKEFCGVTKGVERINERIGERFYVGVYAGRLQKRGIDTMKDCLKKRFGCHASKENRA